MSTHLSPREIEVARLMPTGASNKEIAAKLGVTESTVKVHLKSIMKTLRLKNRVQLAVWVERGNLNDMRPGDIGLAA